MESRKKTIYGKTLFNEKEMEQATEEIIDSKNEKF